MNFHDALKAAYRDIPEEPRLAVEEFDLSERQRAAYVRLRESQKSLVEHALAAWESLREYSQAKKDLVRCAHCAGDGLHMGFPGHDCPYCKGVGELPVLKN